MNNRTGNREHQVSSPLPIAFINDNEHWLQSSRAVAEHQHST